METRTYIFIEPGHANSTIVTAETKEECDEKYFMKYPKRRDDEGLEIRDGAWQPGFGLTSQ